MCPQIDEVGGIRFEERKISVVLITGVKTLRVINMYKYSK